MNKAQEAIQVEVEAVVVMLVGPGKVNPSVGVRISNSWTITYSIWMDGSIIKDNAT